MTVTARAGCAAGCVLPGSTLATCTATAATASEITSMGKAKRKEMRAGFFMS
jgi:hypothetical protein